MTDGPDPRVVGIIAAEHLGPLLSALEVCAVQMANAERGEEARYYRALARRLADAGGAAAGSTESTRGGGGGGGGRGGGA